MEFLKSECPSCGQHIEYPREGVGLTVPCPSCNASVILPSAVSLQVSNAPKTSTHPPPVEEKRSRIPLSQLNEVTIRNRTKSGDTPLHRGAKNGKFAEIPAHLLEREFFMVRNDAGETPLHFAAKFGHLNQIPMEFLTMEALMVLDNYGRTPLHVAADYRHVDQIPKEFLSPEILRMQTKNFRSETILHLAAATNTLDLIPEDLITPELLQIKNGYGLTPLETLAKHFPSQRQLTRLREMGIPFEEKGLTRERAAGLIEAREEEAKKAPPKLDYVRVECSDSSTRAEPSRTITLLAKSSSRKTPYKVEFVADGPSIRVFCHCPAGSAQMLCKHFLALASGDAEMLFESAQTSLLEELKTWEQYAHLKQRTGDLITELRELEEAMLKANNEFMGWYSARRDEQRPKDEEPPMIEFYLPGADDDPEVRRRFRELEDTKDELRDRERSLKQSFMRGLRLGFHRI